MRPQDDQTWTSGLVPMIEPEIVTEIISRVSDLALIVSKDGQVISVMSNPQFGPKTGLSELQGKNLDDDLTVEAVPKFKQRLEDFLRSHGNVLPVELNHRARDGGADIPIRYSFHRVGSDGAVLMLGRDLRPIAEMQQQLVAAQIALEKDYEEQREYDTRFRVLMSASSEATLFVRVSDGKITDCNPAATTLLDATEKSLLGSDIARQFRLEPSDNLLAALTASAHAASSNPVEVTLAHSGDSVVIAPKLFRSAGEHMLLCQLRDPDGRKEKLTDGLERLDALFRNGVDAIVFVNRQGAILSANNAFLNFAEITHGENVRGRSIADFMNRGSVDLNVLIENAARTGAMRIYATRLVSEHGTERPIEISATRLQADENPVYALILRDASRVDALRTSATQLTDVDRNSVVELIGSQTLKDIVARTTDVVEKMCIETAVELTSNNRVAAAEMLGLSRQSLYVKLRKYELL